MRETSKENNKALPNRNEKLLKIWNNWANLASSLLSPVSEITNPEHTSQFKLAKVPNSNWVKDLLMKRNKIRDPI